MEGFLRVSGDISKFMQFSVQDGSRVRFWLVGLVIPVCVELFPKLLNSSVVNKEGCG